MATLISRFVVICTLSVMSHHASAAEARFRISVDAPPNHIAFIVIDRFLDRLEIETGGTVTGMVFDSGKLYGARDEPKAVARGDIEMSLTANLWLSAFAPNYAVFDLPLFSGRSLKEVNNLVDGELGDMLAEGLETRLGVKVLGRMLLLGFVNTFSAGRDIRKFGDFNGIRVRVPGGGGFIARYQAVGAIAISIPFPDVPLALSQGTVDALLTTHETVRSMKAHEVGVTSVFHDQVAVVYYTPLVNKRFWDQLNRKQQAAFIKSWESVIDEGRIEAVQRQAAARAENEEHGITIHEPKAAELLSVNADLWDLVPSIAARLDIDPTIVDMVRSELSRVKELQ